MQGFPIVTCLILLPVLGALALFLVPRKEERTIRHLALSAALIELALAVPLFFAYQFDAASPTFQFTETVAWVPSLGLGYSVGLDGLSLMLVVLTTFLTPIAMLSSWSSIQKQQKEFYACLLFLEAAVIGVFCAMDLVLFYVFWEAMLLPMVLIIGVWGGKRRVYAAYKFFIYTMAGSLLMLAAIVYVYFRAGADTFDIQTIAQALRALPAGEALSGQEATLLFAAFALAFSIKVPIFPLHTWLPDAHTEAPTAGSVMLAAVLLKMGTYGLMRLAIPFFPAGFEASSGVLAVLAVIGIIYGALMALAQDDMKKLIAYSSVSHLGFCVLGIVAWNEEALAGSVYQMLGHGLSTGALFLVIGLLYERHHTRDLEAYGGIAKKAPLFAITFMIATLSSAGLPGLNGFVGEFLVLLGTFQKSPLYAACAALGVILGAVYLLRLYQKLMFGEPRDPAYAETEDLKPRELWCLVPLCVAMVVMGLFPGPFLGRLGPTLSALIQSTQG